MGRALTNNGIKFTSEFITEVLIPQLPEDYIKFWDIKFTTQIGGIRFCKGEVEAIYLFISAKGKDEAILKYLKSPHIDHYDFESLYVRYDIEGKNEFDEYRYDLQNKVVATYNFEPKENGHFCNQYKNGELDKQYVFSIDEVYHPQELQQMIDENIITDFDINNTDVDGMYVINFPDIIYYYIR
jgi:hypothetical protein